MTTTKKPSSHLGAGLLVGTLIGVAAGYFLQSKQGKQLLKDGHKKAEKLQATLAKELNKAGDLSKETYEKLVDKVMDYYTAGKEISKNEAPEIRAFLLKKWKNIEKHLKDVK
jgi:gas vesicle protein